MADERTGDAGDRRLRAVAARPVADVAVVQDAIEASVQATPGGVAPRALAAAVAGHLGLAEDGVPAQTVTVALGLLIATGRVDEVGGRLVPVAQERREAG